MTSFTKIFMTAVALSIVVSPAYSQKKKHHDDDAVVTIRVNGKEKDIETYFEEWGEDLGKKIEKIFDDPKIHIEIDENDLDIDFDNISMDIDDFAESIADVVEEAVTNMTIELKDLDPHDVSGSDIDFDNDEDLEKMIDDIETRYHSKVENIDKMKIKIREDYVKVELKASLKNGRKVEKTKIFAH